MRWHGMKTKSSAIRMSDLAAFASILHKEFEIGRANSVEAWNKNISGNEM